MDLSSKFFDTICAIATPIGEGGIGIIKLSGPEALRVALKVFRPSREAASLRSHFLYHGWIHDPSSLEPVDEVLLSYMAAPATYTREDVVEINCHSGYLVLNRILGLTMKAGARLAEPGEFTRRAFLNGRMDLSQAEAVIDLIHSRSVQSLEAANRQLQGGLRAKVEGLREELLQLEAHIGVSMDFAEDIDDEDTSLEPGSLSASLLHGLIRPIRDLLMHYEEGRALREGLTLALAGKPNVGKSSLMNALVGRDRAIVTPFPGTTRDVIEDTFLLSGVLVRIFDTAGIRRSTDEVESMGIHRAFRSLEESDVVLWLIDMSSPLGEEDDLVFQSIRGLPYVTLLNKSDLPPAVSVDELRDRYHGTVPALVLSALRETDVARLRELLYERFLKTPLQRGSSAIIPNARHKESLESALQSLMRAQDLLTTESALDLVSLELRATRRALDSILGFNVEEDLLDRIFSRFCIGK